jgi:GNAT superfamily N-acetyltransferase
MISLREFEHRDAPELSSLIAETLRRVNIHDYPYEAIEQLVPAYKPANLVQRSKSQHMVVAETGGQIVGTASIDGERVRNVFVESSFQRKGVGRALMSEIEAYALSHGQARLFLFAALSAIGFYEKLGYVGKGHIQHDLGDVSIEELRMEKVLDQDS